MMEFPSSVLYSYNNVENFNIDSKKHPYGAGNGK
jgi:hypothetical protein